MHFTPPLEELVGGTNHLTAQEKSFNNDPLDSIFSRALNGRVLFRNHKALQSDYVPDNLPFRAQQVSSIAEILAPILHGSRPSNLLVYGKTGTGKTAVTRHVISKLEETCSKKKIPAVFVYSNVRMTGTEYRTLGDLASSIGLKIPFTGLAVSEVLSRIQNHVKAQGLKAIFVLDEIDYLVRSYGDDILYDLTNSSDKIAPGFLSLVGISNDLQFKEQLGARVQSRLSEEELVFPPYSAEELRTILTERATLALNAGSYSGAAINLCAALSGSEHGDARRAVDLLRISGEIAEREGSKELTEKHVRIALQKIDQDRISEALVTLPLHAKVVLLSSIYACKNDSTSASSGSVYDKYCELCKLSGLEPLTTRRISGLLTELDTLGLVTASIVNYGRYGRTKKVMPQITASIAEKAFGSDDAIRHLLKIRA
jgi:archaeal cell division control protein 6